MDGTRKLLLAGFVGGSMIFAVFVSEPGDESHRLSDDGAKEHVEDEDVHPPLGHRAPSAEGASVPRGSARHERVFEGVSRGVTSEPPATRTLASMRKTLGEAIERHLPELKLSSTELDDLAGAAFRLRNAQEALRNTPATPEQAERRTALRIAVEEAVGDFTYVAEMSPAEFTRSVDPSGGIDAWRPEDGAEDVQLRPLRERGGAR